MKKVLVFCSILIFVAAGSAFANQLATFGWEDGTSTALGTYGNAVLENSSAQANTGSYSLKITENPLGGTPQTYLWWVTGLTDGDIINASFFCYDTTAGSTYPSGRIWAHSTQTGMTVNDYGASLSGSSTYSAGTGWELLSYSWTFDSASGANDGFVLEARIYSSVVDDFIYVDDTSIDVSSDTATIYDASGTVVPVELQSFSIE